MFIYVYKTKKQQCIEEKIDASRNYRAGQQKISCDFNYFPIPHIVVKGEFCYGIRKSDDLTADEASASPSIQYILRKDNIGKGAAYTC